MANVDAPNGLTPVRHLTGGVVRANEWKIASGLSTAIFTGDCVKLLSTGYIDECDAGDRILGVFAGCSYPNSSGEQIFSRQWTASLATLGSADVTAYVYDDPNIVFAVQSAGSADFADIGNLADIVATAGDTTTGRSNHEVSGTTGTGTAGLRILGLYNEPKNAYGTNGVLETVIWEHELSGHDQGTAGA